MSRSPVQVPNPMDPTRMMQVEPGTPLAHHCAQEYMARAATLIGAPAMDQVPSPPLGQMTMPPPTYSPVMGPMVMPTHHFNPIWDMPPPQMIIPPMEGSPQIIGDPMQPSMYPPMGLFNYNYHLQGMNHKVNGDLALLKSGPVE